MALYGPAELPRVLLVRPDVRAIGLLVMADFETAFPGDKLFVPAFGGWRSDDEQEQIYERSLTEDFRAAPASGHAYHTKGAALDLQIVGTDQDPARDQRDPRYVRLGAIIERHGYRAGVNFRSGDPDPYHLDTGEPWPTVLAQWDALKKKILCLPSPSSSAFSSPRAD
jgi:hypothetical protein